MQSLTAVRPVVPTAEASCPPMGIRNSDCCNLHGPLSSDEKMVEVSLRCVSALPQGLDSVNHREVPMTHRGRFPLPCNTLPAYTASSPKTHQSDAMRILTHRTLHFTTCLSLRQPEQSSISRHGFNRY